MSLQQGRPDLQAIIREEIEQSVGLMSVNGQFAVYVTALESMMRVITFYTVCGSQALVNSVRAGVAPLRIMDVLTGGPSISFHVEW